MINGIGQNAAAAKLAQAGVYPRMKVDSSSESGNSVQAANATGASNRIAERELQAGFGDNTLSTPGAALATLGKGIESARRSIPSLEELRAQQQLKRVEASDEAAQQNALDTETASSAESRPSFDAQSNAQPNKPEDSERDGSKNSDTFSLYSRRSEPTQSYSLESSASILDIKA